MRGANLRPTGLQSATLPLRHTFLTTLCTITLGVAHTYKKMPASCASSVEMLTYTNVGVFLPWGQKVQIKESSVKVYRTLYVFTIYMFFFLNCSHSSYLKIKLLAIFLNPWQTLHHNVKICMGLLIHKTSLFLAFVDKFLCKNGGRGCFVPFSILNLFDIDRGDLLPLYIPNF